MPNIFIRNKHAFLYGGSLAILLFLVKWLELKFVIMNHAIEIYTTSIALVFTILGIWLALKLMKPRIETVTIEKKIFVSSPKDFTANEEELNKLGISKRELQVLQLIAGGYSNKEIASALFVSLNTIKTHSSNLFEKLDVRSRTQAVDRGKKLGIIQ